MLAPECKSGSLTLQTFAAYWGRRSVVTSRTLLKL
jgi:hypothetical protein